MFPNLLKKLASFDLLKRAPFESSATRERKTVSDEDSDSAPSHRSASPTELPPAQRSSSESGSERSSASVRKVKRKLIDSSDDEEGDKGGGGEATAASQLFGDDVSSDSDDERGDARKAAATRSDDSDRGEKSGSEGSIQGIRLYPDPDEEPEQEEEIVPEVMESDVQKIDVDLGGQVPYFCKFPNFLSVETRPFDPEDFEDNEDEDNIDDEGRSRLKLKVENTIRWRYGMDAAGNETRESNAKVVRWSDGTMSLYLGNEIFEISEQPLVAHTHLYTRQATGLMGQAVFDRKLQFRPHSTDSKTHRKVTLNMADRTRKSGQVKVMTEVGLNPDEVKKEAVRKEEEQLRAAIRRETQQGRVRTRDRNRGLTSGYLEDRYDSDDEFRRAPRPKKGDAPLIGASSDESDTGGRRLEGAKEDESDSDEEFRKMKMNQKKKIISSDESD